MSIVTDDPQRRAYAPLSVLKAFEDAGVQLPYDDEPSAESLRDALVTLGLMAAE